MKVLVADDQSMLRDALGKLLIMEESIEKVYLAKDGEEAKILLENEYIDVAILDIEMPKLSGLDVLKWVRENEIDTKIIISTTFARSGYFEKAIKENVDAYILKDRSISDLMYTIKKVLDGKKEYDMELVGKLIEEKNPLTEQEINLLERVAKGLSNKEIAKELHLSDGTVRNYISVILDKLYAENRVMAVNTAKEKGWI